MKVNVQTPNFNPDVELLQYINERLSKLELFYDRIIYADVFLKVQKTSEKENKNVEILLSIPKGDLIVKKAAKSFEGAVNVCLQSLERQLKKRKQRQREKA